MRQSAFAAQVFDALAYTRLAEFFTRVKLVADIDVVRCARYSFLSHRLELGNNLGVVNNSGGRFVQRLDCTASGHARMDMSASRRSSMVSGDTSYFLNLAA